MPLLTSALNTDFTPAIGDFIVSVDGGTVMLMRRNAAGTPSVQCGVITPGSAVIVANPVAGAIYSAAPQSGNPVFRADQ